jgi:uncharacterized protein (TIGR02145 family)
LNAIDWSVGDKFMQVELNTGNGFVDIGTQQMVSVPYALHTEGINYSVSASGDTLYIGNGGYVIVPGISAANPSGGGNGGDGGGGSAGTSSGTTAHTCGVNNVVNTSLTYNSVIDQEGNIYKTVVLGTREWMAENLNVGHFQNGDQIFIVEDDNGWASSILQPFSCYYQNIVENACPYGRIYNFYAVTDPRELCPVGWHVPDNFEWSLLGNAFGGSSAAGGALKTDGTVEEGTSLWYAPNTGATNSSGFSAVPGGYRSQFGFYTQKGYGAYYWAGQSAGSNDGWFSQLRNDSNSLQGNIFDGRFGAAVRCIRDL